MGEEIEIKLLCDDEKALREVFRFSEIIAHLQTPPREVALRAYYLDTPDLRLAGEGIAYRVRQEGGRWVAAVKTGKVRTPEGLYVRGEWERKISRPEADPGIFRGTEIYERLISRLGGKTLGILFEIRVTRSIGLLAYPDGTEIELAADRGEIRCHDLRAPILEVELELKTGAKDRLMDLSRKLQAAFSLVPGTGSKYARGLALFKEAGERLVFPADDVFHV